MGLPELARSRDIAPIRDGVVRNLADHRAAMRAHPHDGGVTPNRALLVYDDRGAVFARLPTKPASDEDAGVVHCRLGTVELPSDVPGSARFRRTMEQRALELLGRT